MENKYKYKNKSTVSTEWIPTILRPTLIDNIFLDSSVNAKSSLGIYFLTFSIILELVFF